MVGGIGGLSDRQLQPWGGVCFTKAGGNKTATGSAMLNLASFHEVHAFPFLAHFCQRVLHRRQFGGFPARHRCGDSLAPLTQPITAMDDATVAIEPHAEAPHGKALAAGPTATTAAKATLV